MQMTLQNAQIQELDRKYKEYINNYTIDLYGYKYKITDETNYNYNALCKLKEKYPLLAEYIKQYYKLTEIKWNWNT